MPVMSVLALFTLFSFTFLPRLSTICCTFFKQDELDACHVCPRFLRLESAEEATTEQLLITGTSLSILPSSADVAFNYISYLTF